MATWSEVKPVLAILGDDPTRPLRSFPSLSSDQEQTPPFRVGLEPWAVEVAAGLHGQFGDDLDLVVGAMRYPEMTLREPSTSFAADSRVLPGLPKGLTVTLKDAIAVRSGHTSRGALILSNERGFGATIHTSGVVTARVVDRITGEVVGGSTGAQALPLVVVRCDAGASSTIPLLVGTAPFSPRLGYVVPPGSWALEAVLHFEGQKRVVPPLLPLLVTP